MASNKVSFVVSSARGRTLPSGAALGSLGSVLGASGASQGGSWELPGHPGEGLGRLLRRLGKHFGAPRERWERKRRKSENHCFT